MESRLYYESLKLNDNRGVSLVKTSAYRSSKLFFYFFNSIERK